MAEYIDRDVAIDELKKDIMGGMNYESILKNLPAADVCCMEKGRNMSILIKDMEMPQDCWHCEFCKTSVEMDFCVINRKQYKCGSTERPSDCPLVDPRKDLEILAQVEVQPVKYGKWIYDGEDYQCSACRGYYYLNYYGRLSGDFKFCPFCGAKMENEP